MKIRCVVLGDGTVGKTCLLTTYATRTFPKNYVPTVFQNTDVKIMIEGVPHDMTLVDTAGQEDYKQVRQLNYQGAHIFILCFDITNKTSFDHLVVKWIPELEKHAPDSKYFIVGCKSDNRDREGFSQNAIPINKCEKIADMKGTEYFETSAMNFSGVLELFDSVARWCIENENEIQIAPNAVIPQESSAGFSFEIPRCGCDVFSKKVLFPLLSMYIASFLIIISLVGPIFSTFDIFPLIFMILPFIFSIITTICAYFDSKYAYYCMLVIQVICFFYGVVSLVFSFVIPIDIVFLGSTAELFLVHIIGNGVLIVTSLIFFMVIRHKLKIEHWFEDSMYYY